MYFALFAALFFGDVYSKLSMAVTLISALSVTLPASPVTEQPSTDNAKGMPLKAVVCAQVALSDGFAAASVPVFVSAVFVVSSPLKMLAMPCHPTRPPAMARPNVAATMRTVTDILPILLTPLRSMIYLYLSLSV